MIPLNNQSDWLINQLEQLIDTETSYEKRAFWYGLKTTIKQQQSRMQQIQAEIDGQLWNHEQW